MLSNRIARLAAPPRWIPLPVVCSTMLRRAGALGALFLIMGLLSTWSLVGDFRPIDNWRLAHSTTTAQAVVTDVIATNTSQNDVPVYKYCFTFGTPGEQVVTARSYSTGQLWSTGDCVTAWYVPNKPTVARLEKTRSSKGGAIGLVVLIFPTIGAALFVPTTVRRSRHVALLRQGEIADAQVISMEATNIEINDKPLMKYAYRFQGEDGCTYLGSSRSLPKEEVGDEEKEPVLYLPSNPRLSILVDALPLRYTLDLDDDGRWVSYEGMWPIVWYSLIWMGILANVVYGLLHAVGAL